VINPSGGHHDAMERAFAVPGARKLPKDDQCLVAAGWVRCREIIVYALPECLWLEPSDSLQRSQSSVLFSSCSDAEVCIGAISGLSATVGWRSIEGIAPQSNVISAIRAPPMRTIYTSV
jgi:hypothetical protein